MNTLTNQSFKNALIERRNNNLALINFNDPKVIRKIERMAERYGKPTDVLLEEISQDPLPFVFCSDAKKQNVVETQVLEYLEEFFPSIIRRRNHILHNGRIVVKERNVKYNCKTFDFEFNYARYRFIGQHKYTEGHGGAQDNQFEDVISFIKEVHNTIELGKNKKTIFFMILDGDYFTDQQFNNHVNRIAYLQDMYAHDRLVICRTNELPIACSTFK